MHQKPYTEVFPGIFVGNWKSSQDQELLDQVGCVICVNKEKSHTKEYKQFLANKNIEFLDLRMDDDETDFKYVRDCWEKAATVIETILEKKQKCIVHCTAGMNRSVCAVTYYLLKQKYKESCKESMFFSPNILQELQKKRSVVCPSDTMILHLKMAECLFIDENLSKG
jgi:protein-tyrosine phosphatase